MDWYEQRDPISFPAAEDGFGQFLDTLVHECSHDPYEPEDPLTSTRKEQAQSTKKPAGGQNSKQAPGNEEHDLQHHLFETSKTEVSGVAAIKDLTAFLMPTYVILHLFSGRRRFNDLQAQLEYITAYED